MGPDLYEETGVCPRAASVGADECATAVRIGGDIAFCLSCAVLYGNALHEYASVEVSVEAVVLCA